jgi:4-hydroxybutyrate CoA-transferase
MQTSISRNTKTFQIALALLVSVFAANQAQAGKFGSRSRSQVGRTQTNKRVGSARLRRSVAKPQKPLYVTADKAMKLVRGGNRVLLPTEAGTSQLLVNALVKRSAGLKGKRPVEILHPASLVKYPDYNRSKLVVNGLFPNSGARNLIGNGLKITPTYLSEIPKLLDRQLKPHVVLIKVSPPDKRGYVNTGASAGLIADLVADPKVKVIAEVSPHVPRTRGETRLHQSHIDAMVKSNAPMTELSWGKTSLVDMAIGRNVARQIGNGSTLQLGIGPIQKAVGEQLAKHGKRINKRGGQFKVRIRSEMIDDGLLTMARAGIISKSRDSVQLGFAVGSRKLYDFLAADKRVKMVSTRKINDPALAGARNKLMAINSGVQIGLLNGGEVCSEAVPRRGKDGKLRPVQYSAVGGQVDFLRAAMRSKGGKGILTMRSTAKGGTISSISLDLSGQVSASGKRITRERFESNLPVTATRNDLNYIATEWGVASLKGKGLVERAQALVKLAHPRFRSYLAQEGQSNLGGDKAAWKQAAKVSQREQRMARAFDYNQRALAGK